MKWLGGIISLAAVALFGLACTTHSAAGFRLPDGSVERGEASFAQLGCNSCHSVYRTDLPAPVALPPVPSLGGPVGRLPTDGMLVTSIINPSRTIVRPQGEQQCTAGSVSRMGTYGDVMTVTQLADLVAFLHTRYELERPPYTAY